MPHRRELLSRSALVLLLLASGFADPAHAQAVAEQESALDWRMPELPPVAPIAPEEYAARRQAFAAALGDGVVLVLGARSPVYDYLPYQQNASFRYLTGIEEPDAALILTQSAGKLEERLFVQARDPTREVWEGARLGPKGARATTRMPAEPADRLGAVLDSLLRLHSTLFALAQAPGDVTLTQDLSFGQQVLARVKAAHPGVTIKPAGGALSGLRAKKSPGELERIRRATYISAEAHRQAMQVTEPDMNEFEIRALVEYFFLRNGGGGPAYASIVGSGPNSTTLHYNADNRCMMDGEVLLFDVGTYYDGYAADVTRTIPINGKFTPEQRAVYDVVLAAQKAAEAQIRPGARWQDLHQAATAELAKGLARIGLIEAPDATYDCGTGSSPGKCPQLRLFYMHGLGHGVGLDVHDPDIAMSSGFQPGSAVTIEPGIYVRRDAFDYLPDTPANQALIQRLRPTLERYANIGVRIEDVYIFDENGVERASRGVPREPDEVEALMKEDSPAAAGRRADVVAWSCPRVQT